MTPSDKRPQSAAQPHPLAFKPCGACGARHDPEQPCGGRAGRHQPIERSKAQAMPPRRAARRDTQKATAAAIIGAVDDVLQQAEAERTDPDLVMHALLNSLTHVTARILDWRMRRSSKPPPSPRAAVSWTGAEGEARKAELIQLCRQGYEPEHIARMLDLRLGQVSAAISRFVPKEFRPNARAGVGRPGAVSEGHSKPLPVNKLEAAE